VCVLQVAERLVFRHAPSAVRVDVRADKESYAPGDTVNVTVRTTDSVSGRPVAAKVALNVTDASVCSAVCRRGVCSCCAHEGAGQRGEAQAAAASCGNGVP